jgi:hypothetical protein
MFRKTVILAALALAAGLGTARADDGPHIDPANLAQLRAANPQPTMSGTGARAEVVAGMERLTVIYDGAATRNLASGGRPMVVTGGDGTYHTVYGG